MDLITLYHVSFDLCEEPTKCFKPRVPKCLIAGEDEAIERICLADSITNCISAMRDRLVFFEDQDFVLINVWKKDFYLLDSNLVSWRDLYEKSLVPDAALTHEYWYINEPITMNNSCYRINNIQEAIARRELNHIIDPKYKTVILDKLFTLGIGDPCLESLDICTIVNHWLRERCSSRYEYDDVLESIKSVMQVPCHDEGVDDELWKCLYGSEPRVERTRWDAEPLKLYKGLDLQELDLSCISKLAFD